MNKALQKKERKSWRLTALFSLFIALLFIFSGCSGEKANTDANGESKGDTSEVEGNDEQENESAANDDEEDDEGDLVEEITYAGHVEDFIAGSCLSCHGSQSPTMVEFDEDPDKFAALMKGPRLDSYENLLVVVNGSEAGALMRRLDDGTNRDDGEPGNMNQYLGATDEERQKNLEMLKEWVGHWTLKRANELTEEDHAQFKVLEK